jgi:hypothetical protein
MIISLWIILVASYILGFILSVVMLKKFGKALDVDHYDDPKDYSNYDDWDSNAQAYTSFSIMWPLFWVGMGLGGFWSLLMKFTNNVINAK